MVLLILIYIEQTEQYHDKRVFVHLQTTCVQISFHISSVRSVSYQQCTMTQMAHFSFPYYLTIPNCEVYVMWAGGNR